METDKKPSSRIPKQYNLSSNHGLGRNAKIMVNFKEEKTIHTFAHRGSREYNELIDFGYKEVGELKTNLQFYWKPEYFVPQHKYLSQ